MGVDIESTKFLLGYLSNEDSETIDSDDHEFYGESETGQGLTATKKITELCADALDVIEQLQESLRATTPPVKWISPDVTPSVDLYSQDEFWVAVKVDRDGLENVYVFLAQYVNRPLIVKSDGDPEDDNCFVTLDGEPMHAVGWYSVKEHADFDGFYEEITFSKSYELLGWAEFVKPLPPASLVRNG